MTSMSDVSEERAAKLIALFEELLSTLPPASAILESARTKVRDGTVVCLKPSNKRAAVFSAHLDDGVPNIVDVSFGTITTFELPTESLLPNSKTFDEILEAVREMGLAVIAGKCTEYFGFLGVRGTIQGADKPLRMATFFHPRLFPKLVRYQPYVSRT